MRERKHNLPTAYDRLEDQITGQVADSIIVHARSHGRLRMPGEFSTGDRPPVHCVEKTSTDPENQGVYHDEILRGGPDHYVLSYDVWNHRDSPSFARLVLRAEVT